MSKATRIISLGFEPRPWQEEVISQLRRFSVLVCHRRAGKTVLAVNLLISGALACTRGTGRFGYVAPFLRQAKLVSWAYVKSFTQSIPNMKFNESTLTATFPNGSILALHGADNPDSLRGTYWDGCVIDEVADLRPNVWGEIIRPALTDYGGWAVFIGTPRGLNLFSELYYAALRDDGWFAASYTVDDTDALPVEEVERARREMSEAQFAQELQCDFSAAVENALISLEDARAAMTRQVADREYCFSAKVMGCDIARYGSDRSCIAFRQGVAGIRHLTFRNLSTMELAAQIALEASRWNPDAIFIDVGGVGAGVYDRLDDLGYVCSPVDFGSRASDRRFQNRRVEMWWRLAEWVGAGGCLPDDEALLADLCAPTFSYANAAGRVALESKDQMRKRGLPSPDIGDSWALTFASEVGPSRHLPGSAAHDRVLTVDDIEEK